jgi:hypothetical protein
VSPHTTSIYAETDMTTKNRALARILRHIFARLQQAKALHNFRPLRPAPGCSCAFALDPMSNRFAPRTALRDSSSAISDIPTCGTHAGISPTSIWCTRAAATSCGESIPSTKPRTLPASAPCASPPRQPRRHGAMSRRRCSASSWPSLPLPVCHRRICRRRKNRHHEPKVARPLLP